MSIAEKTVLLTGGTGMIGAHLVRRLLDNGVRPVLLTRKGSSLLRLQDVAGSLTFLETELTNEAAVADVVNQVQPHVVFHLASTFFNPPTLSAGEHMDVNARGTLNLLEALKDRPETRFILAGSGAVYRGGAGMRETSPLDPGSAFGASKASASILARTYGNLHGLSTVELRLFTAYGPWERPGRLIPHAILKALSGEPVDIGQGDQQRDYVYASDVVEAFMLAATIPDLEAGSVFNLCSGEGTSIKTIATTILDVMDNPVALNVGERKTRADEIWITSGDNTEIREKLGWSPTVGLEEGLRKAIDWYKGNTDLARTLP